MKAAILSTGAALLISAPIAFGGSFQGRTSGPCFQVSIQNQPVNRSSVRQNCDFNVSRTVQAGSRNVAETIQTGSVNDNRVRQYQYDISDYFGRPRHR